MTEGSDGRPLAAAGHVSMTARPVNSAAERLGQVGVRVLLASDDFAVLELRGGTHIVLRQAEDTDVQEASFDLMYDDIDAAYDLFRESGFEVTELSRGKIHDSFKATAPEQFRVRVNSSHASDQPT